MTRLLRPTVQTVADNPVAQVKCEPDVDDINVEQLLNEVLARFEFTLGTSFDLQFLDMAGENILAMRRYIVTKAVENIVTTGVAGNSTMTRTMQQRECQPIGDWHIYNEVANILKSGLSGANSLDLENATPQELQAFVKAHRGKGFKPGTARRKMILEAKKLMQ